MRSPSLATLFAASALSLAPLVPAGAADLTVSSRVDAVTVYRSSARVTRLARLDLPVGDSRVLVPGLPAELDDGSIRVEGKGVGGARVFGVSVERFTQAQVALPEVRAAEARLEGLGDEDRAVDDAMAQARARAKFVESLRSTYSEERAKNLALRAVSAREWADLTAFVDEKLKAAALEVRQAEAKKRELARRIAAARSDLEKLTAKRNETTKLVAVELSAERAGPLELAVSYAVPSAGWTPLWDARLLPESGTVELTFLGTVSQRTGEDWAEARLAVSTAEPGRGLWVPTLEPHYLTRLEPRPRPASAALAAPAPMPLSRAMAEKADQAAAGEAEPEPEARLEAPVAEAEMGLLAATYTAPRRETVDGAGRGRTISLGHYTLKAAVVRTCAPRLDPAAYLTATAQNDTGVPLLPGQARITVGDEFVGRAPLELTPPGGELKLAFGADGRVEVERKVLDRTHDTKGLIGKDDLWVYRVRTSVKNRYATTTVVRLLDLVPVSREEAIRVKVLDGTTPPTLEDPQRPGVRLTELTLGPREERVLELRYEVRFPRGFPIQGLE
jgi:uncharacterized protein (TIGR02231 family)